MVKGTPAFTAWRPRSRYRGSASGAGWTSWSWKTIDSPGYAPSPLPLTHEPRYNPTEVHGHGADRADAVHGQPDVPGRAKVLQHFQVVKHAGRCLAVDRPEPVCARGPVQRCFNQVPSHWEPPVDPQDLEPQQHPPRVVHKSVPKLAAADDQSATGEQRKLARYRVVGHRA